MSGGMMVGLLADGVVGDGWILRSFICVRNNAYLHPYHLPRLLYPSFSSLTTTHYPQTLLNSHKPPI
jgi:hypothetical protein